MPVTFDTATVAVPKVGPRSVMFVLTQIGLTHPPPPLPILRVGGLIAERYFPVAVTIWFACKKRDWTAGVIMPWPKIGRYVTLYVPTGNPE